jgi:hypothetical protein
VQRKYLILPKINISGIDAKMPGGFEKLLVSGHNG